MKVIGESEKLGEKFKKSDQKSLSLSLEKATQILKNRDQKIKTPPQF